ncbi:uncharacterized protein LOC112086025 isoform X2 [Eutrema salsugineum]|uniref:uncharacterized protein LOC112086025 isoform X2 n=1 Tax=Eutrema salsugineum TaxID=72664 RepID=UPI000CED61EB|nr:uncharacterized protein LOC112086025 isoform X2 [Eutrema salsugineum]
MATFLFFCYILCTIAISPESLQFPMISPSPIFSGDCRYSHPFPLKPPSSNSFDFTDSEARCKSFLTRNLHLLRFLLSQLLSEISAVTVSPMNISCSSTVTINSASSEEQPMFFSYLDDLSSTWNQSVLTVIPATSGDPVLRSEPFQEVENDEEIETSITQADKELITIPTMRHASRTRSGTKSLREEFNNSIEHEELKEKLLKGEITQETPMEREFNTLEIQDLEITSGSNLEEFKDFQETKNTKETSSNDYSQLKLQTVSFLPVLQGNREAALFPISKQPLLLNRSC